MASEKSKNYKCPECGGHLTIEYTYIEYPGGWCYPYRKIVCKKCKIESNLVDLEKMTTEEKETEKWVDNHVTQWRKYYGDPWCEAGELISYTPIKVQGGEPVAHAEKE